MLLLSIGTVAPALSKREVSALADIREGVTLLGNVANGSRSLMVNYLNNETSGVLFTVCLLRNYTWSRNTISQLKYDALIAVKDAVINNSCSWLSSLGQSISCDQLSDYCSTTEVMIKINNWLYAKLATRLCLDWISDNLGDKREEISKLCSQQQ
eukprot:Em0001g2464a